MAPTQVKYPLRAALRTGAAALLAVATIAPLAWAVVVDELTKANIAIPPSITSFMATVLAAFVAVTAIFTRIMAIPQVAELMTRVLNSWLGCSRSSRDTVPASSATAASLSLVASDTAVTSAACVE